MSGLQIFNAFTAPPGIEVPPAGGIVSQPISAIQRWPLLFAWVLMINSSLSDRHRHSCTTYAAHGLGDVTRGRVFRALATGDFRRPTRRAAHSFSHDQRARPVTLHSPALVAAGAWNELRSMIRGHYVIPGKDSL